MTTSPPRRAPSGSVAPSAARLKAVLGHYPNTTALKTGTIASDRIAFDFDPVAKPAHAFKRVVHGEFDLAELSIVTYLIAQSRGYPLALLPAVMFSRIQHPYLVCDVRKGPLSPSDLAGKRIGVAYYTTATSTWLRHVLADDHGVDPTTIQWHVLETPHVAGFEDPANVHLLPSGADLLEWLLAGALDALIVTPVPAHPCLATVIPHADAAADAWHRRHGHLQLNHMVVTTDAWVQQRPDAVREMWRMLVAAKGADARTQGPGVLDSVPYGLTALRPHLDAAIDCVYRQGLIPRRPDVDELFCDVTRALDV